MSLEGKTVILFGAGAVASGYAPLFADNAQNVVIVSRRDSCERLAEEVKRRPDANISGEVIPMHADASDYAQIGRAYDETLRRFSRVDVVINGSGGNMPEAVVSGLDDFIGMAPSVAEGMMAANYLSKRYSLQHFARILRDGGYEGSAVNITSMSGFRPLSKVIDYSAAYAAVENLTASLAQLYGRARIGRVNNLAIGFTIGEQNRKLLLKEDGTPTPRGEEILAGTSQSRFLGVKEIAPHVLYLADSERSGAINGHTLRVDGGYNLVSLPATAGYAPKK
jgi:NAD(P)-dependent dehydrogenase (short-subunit alcohol dehydrogenase family)